MHHSHTFVVVRRYGRKKPLIRSNGIVIGETTKESCRWFQGRFLRHAVGPILRHVDCWTNTVSEYNLQISPTPKLSHWSLARCRIHEPQWRHNTEQGLDVERTNDYWQPYTVCRI